MDIIEIVLRELHSYILHKELSSTIFQSPWVSESGIGNTCPDLHFLQFIKAWMSSTDPVSSITNCHRLIVSYTDPVHSFIISYRAVEPTGSSLQLLLGIVIGNYHLQLAISLTNKTILITGWNWSCLEIFLLFTTMATAGNWPFDMSNIS